jgi:uncharacterized protein (DUF58 family)
MILPTTRTWIFVGLGIILALAGSVISGLERVVILYNITLLVLCLLAGAWAKRIRLPRITRITDPALSARVRNAVTLRIENETNQSIQLCVRDEAPENCRAEGNEFKIDLDPFQIKNATYHITPTSRGEWQFRGLFVRIQVFGGLVQVEKQVLPACPVHIYPNIKAVQEFELLKQTGHLSTLGMRQSRQKGLGMEFESLREYNDDDFRKIDWKASARRGKLVVRNFEQETNQGVVIGIDLGRHMLGEVEGVRKLDHCLDAALLLMHAAERAGDQVGLLTFNDTVKNYIAPRRGKAQISRLLSAIYDAQAEPTQPNYGLAFGHLASRWKRRSLIVIFTDAENADQASHIAASLGSLKKRHLVYVVRVSDPRLRTYLASPIESEGQLFDQAAAHWYLSDRRKAEAALRGVGIQSVEAEPQDLARQLVSAYLRVKRLSLI